MKDYKGRGSNLRFRERRAAPRGRLLLVAAASILIAAVVYFGRGWLRTDASPGQTVAVADTTEGDAIPLSLPPAPPGYVNNSAGGPSGTASRD